MKLFKACIEINAPPEVVWAVLTDASHYADWEPLTVKLEGRIALGEKLTSYSKPAPTRPFYFIVSAFDPPKRMVWSSGMPLGLIKGELIFLLVPQETRTLFTLQEEFSGLLLSLVERMFPDMNRVFADFCMGLKLYVEQRS